jgi:hypothetical protein
MSTAVRALPDAVAGVPQFHFMLLLATLPSQRLLNSFALVEFACDVCRSDW